MELINKFNTTQCELSLYDTKYKCCGVNIYMLISVHKRNNKQLIRFGTQQQIESMLNSYNLKKIFEL